MIKTDVLIIGGGIIGCSIAHYLAKEGIETVLVEKDDIASGASGACDGFIFLQSKAPGIHLEMALKSAKSYESLSSVLGPDLEYEKCGGMVVAENEEELNRLKNLAQRQQTLGLNVNIISADEARSKVPGLAAHIQGASFCSQDAQVNPILATLAFADEARKRGVRILTGTSVSGMELSERGKERFVRNVVTDKGKIKANFVVNAAGAESPTLCEMVDFHLPITPRRGQILVTESLPKTIDCLIMNMSYVAAKFCQTGIVSDTDWGVTFEQTKAGNLLIGSTREFAGYNKKTTYKGLTSIASNAVKLIPESESFKVIRSFAGLRPHTPDNLPVIGYLDGIKNLIIASGHEGDGIALAPVTGRIIAELIIEGKTSIDISELSPNRFQDAFGERKRK